MPRELSASTNLYHRDEDDDAEIAPDGFRLYAFRQNFAIIIIIILIIIINITITIIINIIISLVIIIITIIIITMIIIIIIIIITSKGSYRFWKKIVKVCMMMNRKEELLPLAPLAPPACSPTRSPARSPA